MRSHLGKDEVSSSNLDSSSIKNPVAIMVTGFFTLYILHQKDVLTDFICLFANLTHISQSGSQDFKHSFLTHL